MKGLYIHIPFCESKCLYCDFATVTRLNRQIDPYLSALRTELSFYQGERIDTLFIGGGTPTVLNTTQIKYLMTSLHELIDLSSLTEATVEANPESASREVLQAYKEGGLNRISFGLQTTDEPVLSQLNRLHNKDDFFEAYVLARQLGFNNINVDLMYGLPQQTLSSWEKTLDVVGSLNPEHISTYALKIESGTFYAKKGIGINDDLEADMYLLASSKLTEKGYGHYEISNFAKPGHESLHNQLYWKNDETIGVGLSSTSYRKGRRTKNTPRLQMYLQSCQQGLLPVVEETVLKDDQKKKEALMLQLRMKDGVEASNLMGLNIPMATTFLETGFGILENGRYSLTPQGWLVSNQLFQYLV